jgi:hypothetical protein
MAAVWEHLGAVALKCEWLAVGVDDSTPLAGS